MGMKPARSNTPSKGAEEKASSQGLSIRVRQFSLLPDEAQLSADEIKILSGRSRTSIWRDVRNGHLPAPVHIAGNAARWRAVDVRTYLKGSMK